MGYVACITKMRNACRTLVSNLKGIDHLKDSGTDERILKLILKEQVWILFKCFFHSFYSVMLTDILFSIIKMQDIDGNCISDYPNVLIFCYSSCVADAMGSPRLLRQTFCRCTYLNSASLFFMYVFIYQLFKSYVTKTRVHGC